MRRLSTVEYGGEVRFMYKKKLQYYIVNPMVPSEYIDQGRDQSILCILSFSLYT